MKISFKSLVNTKMDILSGYICAKLKKKSTCILQKHLFFPKNILSAKVNVIYIIIHLGQKNSDKIYM